MIEQLKIMLAATLSQVVQSVGPVPDKYGELVRRVLNGTNDMAILALGCYLDECIEKKNYEALERAQKDIK